MLSQPHEDIPTNLNLVCGRSSFSFGNSESHEELEDVVDDLNPAEDGEAGEKTHCASY